MNDIIDEVKSELQQENISKLISKYWKYVIAAAFLILVSVSVFVYISNNKIERQETLSKAYAAFQKSDKKTLPDYVKKSPNNIYTDLANINYATTLKNSGKHRESLAQLLEIMNKTTTKETKNLSAIHASFIILKHYNEANKELFLSKIKIFPVKTDEPFAELLNWLVYQIKIVNSSPAKKQELLKILKSSESKSQNIKLMNDILINSIKNK
jgi:predicted negative regulator of RcsB-dependent stress response